ncbi:hypothetical protein CPB83DRAFT_813344 [Crepidotus variabilis]|uniref:Uncharacterized protein n=1 Tax=Crepidotus variabilis TaxID=179855 RepID=A0A9P6EH27_9AGAR|nr:hypothetical protein CPB83DRAFT_813344 [Crepidotus variabilis]
MLSAFKIKEYDLQPIFEQWKDAPTFNNNPKKDLPVEEWLEKIREGCVERGVPEEYWYKVAQHFMGPRAKARLDELKQVISKVHGGKYRWTWKKFKVAMLNMGWTIDKDQKETIKVQGRSSGMWFSRKKDTDTASVKDLPQDPPAASSSSSQRTSQSKSRPSPTRSIKVTKKPLVQEPEEDTSSKKSSKGKESTEPRGRPMRAASVSGFWPGKLGNSSKDDSKTPQRPGHQKARSDTAVVLAKRRSASPAESTHSASEVVTKAEAPAWLLNACTALEFITSEHPKAMSVISAILITAGSIPAIPAIAAGAGGTILASGAVHAIGAIAVAAGQALGAGVAAQKNQQPAGVASITEGH